MAGQIGWRWWLAPLAMLIARQPVVRFRCWWPWKRAVRPSTPPIATKSCSGRPWIGMPAAWHHVKTWYYFILEVIPPLWLPWSLLLFWLVPRFRVRISRS